MRTAGGEKMYSLEYPVRSHTGTPFRQVAVTADGAHLIAPAADKAARDCVHVYNFKTGAFITKIPIKLPGFRVIIITVSKLNLI